MTLTPERIAELNDQANRDSIHDGHTELDCETLLTLLGMLTEVERLRSVVAAVKEVVNRGTLYEDAKRVHEFTHPTELAHRVAALTMATLDDLRTARDEVRMQAGREVEQRMSRNALQLITERDAWGNVRASWVTK